MRFVVAAVLLTACFRPVPAEGVPCSSSGACPDGQQCDVSTSPPTCASQLQDAAPASEGIGPADGPGDGRGDATASAFGPGTLIIPMDDAFQDAGQLRAFGLVDRLLVAGVPVNWVIHAGKAAGDPDLTTDAAIVDRRSAAVIVSPTHYVGGPFVIASADRARALPVIDAWLAGDAVTTVHDVTAGSFAPEIARVLLHAPRIAILADGDESIAYEYLNSAGLQDSSGSAWGSGSRDVLTEAAIAGPTTTDHADGALAGAGFCELTAMHYAASTATPEVAAEVRAWLTGSRSHALLECLASLTLENAGHFLTTAGIVNTSVVTTPVDDVPDDPSAQFDGTFVPSSGALASIGLGSGSTFAPGVHSLIHAQAAAITTDVVVLNGLLDGDPGNGSLTYLGGHSYTTGTPMSANATTIGARLYLDDLFAAPCVSAP